jgi:hypothetical protein
MHGYLSTCPMYACKYGVGVAYNEATGRGLSSAGASTNLKSLALGQAMRLAGWTLEDFARFVSGGPPAGNAYQKSEMFPPGS